MRPNSKPNRDIVLASPAREYLRSVTADHHKRIELAMNLEAVSCRAQYRQLLMRMLGFYRPMEKVLADIPWDELGLNYAERRKTSLLIRDLLAIGATRQQVANVPDAAVPELAGPAGALGCCYVIEGATLGGQLIARHLKTVLELDPANGAAFFNGYGRATGAMWRSFCSVLNAEVRNPLSHRTAAAAACATFDCLDACLRCRGETRMRISTST